MRGAAILSLTPVLVALSCAYSSPALAMSDDEIRQRLETLQKQLDGMKQLEQQVQDLKAQLAATDRKADAAQKQAEESDNASIKFHLSGAGVADFSGSDGKGEHDSFGGGQFLPIFLAQYKDWLLFEGHMEVTTNTDAGTDVSLEYAQLDLMATDWLTFVAGKFLSPVGQFQQALHPPWINKLPDRPAGFVEDGGDEPLSDVGAMARGGFPIGSMKATYAVYVGNGPRMSDTGPKLEGFGDDNNDDKAVGGRISFFPWPYLELGVSGMRATITGTQAKAGTVSSGDYRLLGADFAFTQGPWDIRGELIRSHLDALTSALNSSDATPTRISATNWTNWYLQAAYRLSGLTDDPVLGNFEPVVRYGQFHVGGFQTFAANAENRISFGLDYWFAPSVVAKIAYENRDFLNKATDDVYRLQFVYGF